MKARRKLEQETTQLSRIRYGCQALPEDVDVFLSYFISTVRELLPRLDRELEFRRRARNPSFCRFGSAWAIESGVHFDGIEIPRVELQFVNFS